MRVTDLTTINDYYEALLARKPSFIGIFYVGVKTTNVFCIATCRARKPKLKNVEFFTQLSSVLAHGYRPCKICKPTENTYTLPEEVQKAMALLQRFPKEKIGDQRLREATISPTIVRRWFNKYYGMTFQAYQRMYRINSAWEELKKGKKTTDTAYNIGYESLSGFAYTYKKVVGFSPTASKAQNSILISRIETPLGPMFIAATTQGICLLEFVDRKMLETELKELQKYLKAPILLGENEHIIQGKKELTAYFEGTSKQFEVALDHPGTTFQKATWTELQKIPYGRKLSYQEQAIALGRPKAVRAVANANGANRIAIIIPCHRVLGKDGQLRGYGGGIERKRWLLKHEQEYLNN